MTVKNRPDRNTIEIQQEEYVPDGPVVPSARRPEDQATMVKGADGSWARVAPKPKPKPVKPVPPSPPLVEMPRGFSVGVPAAQRLSGHVYDANSGVCIGPASDELKAKHAPGIVWEDHIAGCKCKMVIHP